MRTARLSFQGFWGFFRFFLGEGKINCSYFFEIVLKCSRFGGFLSEFSGSFVGSEI